MANEDLIWGNPRINRTTGAPAVGGSQGISGMMPPAGGGSTIDELLAMLRGTQQKNPMADLGSTLGAFSQGQKANRITEGNFRGDFDRMMLDRERAINDVGLGRETVMNKLGLEAQDARNRNEADALTKLQQTSYLSGGGSNFAPPSISLGGRMRTAPTFSGIGPMAPSAAEAQGATDLQGQLMGRFGEAGSFQPTFDFKPEWNYQPTPVEQYARPGLAENIGSYGGAIAGGIGGLMDAFGRGADMAGTAGNIMSGIGGGIGKVGDKIGSFFGGSGAASGSGAVGAAGNVLGKIMPAAGAITGGMGLLKDRGTGSNVMNGLTAGSSIGTMIAPGIGTAIGAGAGALAGFLRGIGGPSEREVEGREHAGLARQSMVSGATQQQIQQANSAGWKNPQDALALIVLRDKLLERGGTSEQANQLMDQLYKAEKGGPQAVEQAINNIMTAINGGRQF